jgi:excisionase family DNA binding protein
MSAVDEVLTVAEVAVDLRCSKPHAYKLINGQVAGVGALPAITVGRRKLVRRSSLEYWKMANEQSADGGMLPTSPEVDASGRMKGEFHA